MSLFYCLGKESRRFLLIFAYFDVPLHSKIKDIMNTQNTPIHVRLWHRDFWLLSLASLLLSMSVYVLVPSFPVWLLETENLSASEVGVSMAAFAFGLYGFGFFCSWLVQRFRRN